MFRRFRRPVPLVTGTLLLLPTLWGQAARRLDTTTFVAIGEGLAAGQSGPGVSEITQRGSFPALIARQLGTAFSQPLLQGPGMHDVLGVPSVPVNAPSLVQGATRVQVRGTPTSDPAPPLFILNISVPNARLADALTRRPAAPLIQENDRQQTIVNLTLGFPQLILNRDVPLWSQAEYAEALFPTLALIELGYFEALESAVKLQPELVPAPAIFRQGYASLVQRLRNLQTQVVVTTIPDPTETGYFLTPQLAARFTGKTAMELKTAYGLADEDRITINGLKEIGNQALRGKTESLAESLVLRAGTAAQIRDRVRAVNTDIQTVARENGAIVYDLAGFFARMKSTGMTVTNRRITGDYFGGFYSFDGFYPGVTGHALIANELLTLLNRTYGTSFVAVDLNPVAQADPVLQMLPTPEAGQ